MRAEVKRILKEKGHESLFTVDRYLAMRNIMRTAMILDRPLKEFLSLDPLNKAEWIADHIIKYEFKPTNP